MSTQTRPDGTVLDDLDFTPKCQTEMKHRGRFRRKWRHQFFCAQPATYLGILPCCGHEAFQCGEHRLWNGRSECAQCGHIFWGTSSWTWRKL